jgi:hypothetical protein
MLASTENKGFQLTFKNGYTISVQFGRGNYCSNRNNLDKPEEQIVYKSVNAEVAAWDSLGAFVSLDTTACPVMYCSADEVAELINKVKSFLKK